MPFLADCWKGTEQEHNATAYKSIWPNESCSICYKCCTCVCFCFAVCLFVCFFNIVAFPVHFVLCLKKNACDICFMVFTVTLTCTENEDTDLESRPRFSKNRKQKESWRADRTKMYWRRVMRYPPNGGWRVRRYHVFSADVCATPLLAYS